MHVEGMGRDVDILEDRHDPTSVGAFLSIWPCSAMLDMAIEPDQLLMLHLHCDSVVREHKVLDDLAEIDRAKARIQSIVTCMCQVIMCLMQVSMCLKQVSVLVCVGFCPEVHGYCASRGICSDTQLRCHPPVRGHSKVYRYGPHVATIVNSPNDFCYALSPQAWCCARWPTW